MLDSGIERTNTLYGALDLEETNVVYVHGSIDPWHALGIIESKNPEAPAIYINGEDLQFFLDFGISPCFIVIHNF